MINYTTKRFKDVIESFFVLYGSCHALTTQASKSIPQKYTEIGSIITDRYRRTASKSKLTIENTFFGYLSVNTEKNKTEKVGVLVLPIKEKPYTEAKVIEKNIEVGLTYLVNVTLPFLVSSKEVEFKEDNDIAIPLVGSAFLIDKNKALALFDHILGKSKYNFKVYDVF